jgi:hypothetical protein
MKNILLALLLLAVVLFKSEVTMANSAEQTQINQNWMDYWNGKIARPAEAYSKNGQDFNMFTGWGGTSYDPYANVAPGGQAAPAVVTKPNLAPVKPVVPNTAQTWMRPGGNPNLAAEYNRLGFQTTTPTVVAPAPTSNNLLDQILANRFNPAPTLQQQASLFNPIVSNQLTIPVASKAIQSAAAKSPASITGRAGVGSLNAPVPNQTFDKGEQPANNSNAFKTWYSGHDQRGQSNADKWNSLSKEEQANLMSILKRYGFSPDAADKYFQLARQTTLAAARGAVPNPETVGELGTGSTYDPYASQYPLYDYGGGGYSSYAPKWLTNLTNWNIA